jgi:pimeloyl-ACP methyl ester carboxylesterase
MDIKPFEIHVPERTIDDLRERLARTRWPDAVADAGWDYGASLEYVRELAGYWRDTFDWPAQEAALNRLPHFRASVDGFGIHFIHQRGTGPAPMPLIVTHGWPFSVLEELKILPLLTDPGAHGGDSADAFDIVVPSLPGFGFSDRPRERGVGSVRAAELWHRLMTDGLGYERFGAQGGDIGAIVTSRLGFAYPGSVIGIHISTAMVTPPPYLGEDARELSAAERDLMAERERWYAAEHGYSHMHRTKPQTLSFGLNDSPAGMLAWIVEKFRTWSDCGGDVETRFTKDELLSNATIYWATETIGSSVRSYYESAKASWSFGKDERVAVPTGFALYPGESSRPPREWSERSFNVQRWTVMPSGGHFGTWEEPELTAEDIRAFFRPLRS